MRRSAQKILASRRFASSERHCRLFRYLLAKTLGGKAAELKEYVMGVEVFDRGNSFDPQIDPIVRTELSRLRAKLAAFYEAEGRADSLVIDLPKRSYSLAFKLTKHPARMPRQNRRRRAGNTLPWLS